MPVTATIHLRRDVRTPSASKTHDDSVQNRHDGKQADLEPRQNVQKQKRSQPKGLRMRFLPVGFGDGDPGRVGSTESEEGDDQSSTVPRFRLPTGVPSALVEGDFDGYGVADTPRKRKRDEVDDSGTLNADGRSEKKRKKQQRRDAREKENGSPMTPERIPSMVKERRKDRKKKGDGKEKSRGVGADMHEENSHADRQASSETQDPYVCNEDESRNERRKAKKKRRVQESRA